MTGQKKYYERLSISSLNLQNMEEKKVIHELENKGLEVDVERLKGKKTVNELR